MWRSMSCLIWEVSPNLSALGLIRSTAPGTGARDAPRVGGRRLVVEGLSFAYDETPVLEDISLEVRAGSVTALLGPSGCGKTTLLRVIAGLERPQAGAVRVDSDTLSTPERMVLPERRRIGMVFQDGALFPHLSVAENVAFGLPRGSGRAGAVAEALELVGLTGFGERSPGTLSGGQRQRAALARALAPGPELLLLDEPFANLDPVRRVELRGEVAALLQRLGVTSVFVTHDQEEAFVMGDQVVVMNEGHVLQSASASELYGHPSSRWVATFVGEANLVAGRSSGTRAETPLGTVPLTEAAAGACEVLLRPEHLALEPGGGWEVERLEFYGHDSLYVLRDDAGRTLTARAAAAPLHHRGDRVSVRYAGPPTVAFPTP